MAAPAVLNAIYKATGKRYRTLPRRHGRRQSLLETTNRDCPYVGKHYRAGNMQAQQREAAGKGVVWLTVASSAPGEQGYGHHAGHDGGRVVRATQHLQHDREA